MLTVEMVTEFLGRIAPLGLAEDWDNVGLLVGGPNHQVQRVMTCLTVTPNVVAEAVEGSVDLIVTHHPMPFHAVKRLTPDTPTGQMLLDLIASRVAVYSAHTAFDSAANGINQSFWVQIGKTPSCSLKALILADLSPRSPWGAMIVTVPSRLYSTSSPIFIKRVLPLNHA